MIPRNRKTYLLLSAIILALAIYKLSIESSQKPSQNTTTSKQTSLEYEINTQPLNKNKQGTIASH